jgi:hypothetical protein
VDRHICGGPADASQFPQVIFTFSLVAPCAWGCGVLFPYSTLLAMGCCCSTLVVRDV